MIRLIWDESKRDRNHQLHGYRFEDAYDFDWDDALIIAAYPSRTGRRRLRATGWLGDTLVTIIFSPLGTEAYSIISMRNAGRKEQDEYANR
jgi:uncharacterized DUF497 family protein